MTVLQLFVLALLSLAVTSTAAAQSAANVAVVINDADASSQRVGAYYVQQRGIPPANVIRIKTTTDDVIDRTAFNATIQRPIVDALSRERLHDRVLYLVLIKGIPLRISGTIGPEGTTSSVDSELALLYRRMVGTAVLTRGRIDNPYYLGTRRLEDARPFTHRHYDIFLVSRLDGFTAEDAEALVDRARQATTQGRIVLDQRDAPVSRLGDDWLSAAAQRLSAAGAADRVLLETTTQPVRDIRPVLGYYSWGSSDPQNRVRDLQIGFAPGALAGTFVSSDARTFKEPPATWQPSATAGARALYAGSAESLLGDLVRSGVTGAIGHVSEPQLQSVARPDVLFAAYLAGFNLVESFYLALPHLSWQAVVVGDPLCQPFSRSPVQAADLDPGIDVATDLPSLFAARRIQQVSAVSRGVDGAAVALWVRGSAARERGDMSAAVSALERAIEASPRHAPMRLELALIYEQAKQIEPSIEQYQRILALEPNHVVALNNLAFALAVHRKAPAEALPLATRAATLSPMQATVIDTLGWVEHLMGDDQAASRHLAEAIRRDPNAADIRLHAATVYAALKVRALAERELKEALRLNPALAESDDVRELQKRISALTP
jgi:uncharacterized protein (TIGR03790 family)